MQTLDTVVLVHAIWPCMPLLISYLNFFPYYTALNWVETKRKPIESTKVTYFWLGFLTYQIQFGYCSYSHFNVIHDYHQFDLMKLRSSHFLTKKPILYSLGRLREQSGPQNIEQFWFCLMRWILLPYMMR